MRTPRLPTPRTFPSLCLATIALAACASPSDSQPQATPTFREPAATLPNPTLASPTAAEALVQPTPTATQASGDKALFPLSTPGPYRVGRRTFTLEDPSRDGRLVGITIWYPALEGTGLPGSGPRLDADADTSGAPYPLLLSSTKAARIFAPYLVSRGFTWASVDHIDSYMKMENEMFDQPLDILFALNQAASNQLEGLGGMIDAERAGAMGYSFDGYNTLALSGARIDPQYYLSQCPDPDPITKPLLSGLSAFNCGPASDWPAFAAQAGEAITKSDDGMWQPMSDPRIRAVMPLAGEGWWLFGERGLAAADRPALFIVATGDLLYPENALIFEHLGTADKALISFVGPDHMMIYNARMVARMAHFAAAFFGYHLQGKDDLAHYFSEEWVAQCEDLAWGVQPTD